MYLAHAVAGYSISDTAVAFKRDYTLVLHAIRKIEKEVGLDPGVAGAIARMRANIHEMAGGTKPSA